MTQQYGDYEVESFLGKGSIGKVYLARHRRIGRRVALKTVHLEQKFEDDEDRSEFYKRLQREAELCGAIQHPNVVTLYDVGYEDDRVTYLATEYVDGESLLARLRRTRPLPLDEALNIAIDLLRGLAYAHAKGIIHRDIKPANILLTSEGHAKIADFGIARPLHSSLTATRSLVGTPNYMSPEQVRTTPVSTRSDLFSAGAVLHEMLTGLKPFGAPELSAILYNVVNLVPPRVSETNPHVPEAIARVVAKLLEKKPEHRYATADEALADLEMVRKTRAAALDRMELDTLAIGPGDATTPLPTIIDYTPAPLLRRPIPPPVFWLVTLLLIAALGASVMTLRHRIAAEKPVGVISPDRLRIADAKRDSLEAARALAYAGKFEEAIAAYTTHLNRFPQATAAREERDSLQKKVAELKASKAEEPRVTRKPKRVVPEAEPAPEEKKLSRMQRLRRWLNEDTSKPREKKKN